MIVIFVFWVEDLYLSPRFHKKPFLNWGFWWTFENHSFKRVIFTLFCNLKNCAAHYSVSHAHLQYVDFRLERWSILELLAFHGDVFGWAVIWCSEEWWCGGCREIIGWRGWHRICRLGESSCYDLFTFLQMNLLTVLPQYILQKYPWFFLFVYVLHHSHDHNYISM